MPSGDKVFALYAWIVRWHDGDSFYGIVDQGFYDYMGTDRKPVMCRCYGLSTPELRVGGKPNPAGEAARAAAMLLAPAERDYRVLSIKPPGLSAGFAIGARPVLDVVLPSGELLRDRMIELGHDTTSKESDDA